MTFRSLAAGLAMLAGSLAAQAQFAISPAQPAEFDPVVLRMTVDSCVYDSAFVAVQMDAGVIRVTTAVRQCLLPGPMRVIDVQLGTFPFGSYRVELRHLIGGDIVSPVIASIPFNVAARPQIAVFPPPSRPLNNYSGNWYDPRESGWGITLHQSPTRVVFGELLVYGANGAPDWYTFSSGQWKSATRWEGTVYASRGSAFSAPVFDPAQLTVQAVGSVSIEFEQSPGTEGVATLSYNVGAVQVTKRIQRLAF